MADLKARLTAAWNAATITQGALIRYLYSSQCGSGRFPNTPPTSSSCASPVDEADIVILDHHFGYRSRSAYFCTERNLGATSHSRGVFKVRPRVRSSRRRTRHSRIVGLPSGRFPFSRGKRLQRVSRIGISGSQGDCGNPDSHRPLARNDCRSATGDRGQGRSTT